MACHVGPSAANLNLISIPNGATVTVRTNSQQFSGELLSVRDDGIVILREERLALVPYGSIRSVIVSDLPAYSVGAGVPSAERRARLNALSRYPQGIGTELQGKLFAQSKQTELEVLH
jgi:hypothetical protein